MTIELRDLRWAIVASQHRSLRKAAEALNIRQSTLSRRLRDIEAHLGAQLFERTNGGTHPTVAGVEFLASAHQIILDSNAAFCRLRARSRGESGHLTIGIYASLSTGNMHATLVDFHRRYPAVDVRTVDGDHDQLLCALANRTIDIAIMTVSRSGWDDRALSLWSERVIVAFNKQHALGGTPRVTWSEIAGEPILVPGRGPGAELERLLTSRLGAFGRQRLLYQDCGLDRLLTLVSADYGILLMLEGATGVHHEGVAYRALYNGEEPERLNFTGYWCEANSNPTLGVFVEMLRQRYPDLSLEGGSS